MNSLRNNCNSLSGHFSSAVSYAFFWFIHKIIIMWMHTCVLRNENDKFVLVVWTETRDELRSRFGICTSDFALCSYWQLMNFKCEHERKFSNENENYWIESTNENLKDVLWFVNHIICMELIWSLPSSSLAFVADWIYFFELVWLRRGCRRNGSNYWRLNDAIENSGHFKAVIIVIWVKIRCQCKHIHGNIRKWKKMQKS